MGRKTRNKLTHRNGCAIFDGELFARAEDSPTAGIDPSTKRDFILRRRSGLDAAAFLFR